MTFEDEGAGVDDFARVCARDTGSRQSKKSI